MRIIISTILFLLLFINPASQINIRSVEQFTVEEGLSQNSVYSLLQDSRGVIWIGTQSGINKFNGYEIIPHQLFEEQSLFTSRGAVYDIIEDREGNIWYSSTETLSRLDVHSESSQNLRTLLKKNTDKSFGNILGVYQDSNGNIWFGSFGQGLFKVSKDFSEIKNFSNDPESTNDSSLDFIRNFYEDDQKNLWLATYGGLVKFNTKSEEFMNIFSDYKDEDLQHVTILDFAIQGDQLILATGDHGLLKYNLKNDKIIPFSKKYNNTLQQYYLNKVVIDNQNRIWVTAEKAGVFVIDEKNDSITNLSEFVGDEINQALQMPVSLIIDRTGIVWIGTELGGLIKIVLGEKYFKTISHKISAFKKIENNNIYTIGKSNDNMLWISTPSGLYKIDIATEEVTRLKISEEIKSSYYKVYNIAFVDNYAWLSQGRKLIKHNLNNNNYEEIDLDIEATINDLNVVDDHKLFIGTSENNCYSYDIEKENLKSLNLGDNPEDRISILESYLDTADNLWIGTINNLYKIDLTKDFYKFEKIELPNSIEYIASLTRIDDKLWLGTYGNGIFSYDLQTKNIEHYSMKDGLSDNIVYGLVSDEDNKLWMSSNRGISQFDPVNKTFKNFNLSDGLQGYEFNSKAYLITEDNQIFYGGINGLNYFYPHKIESNLIAPKTLISKVILYDSTVVANVSYDYNKVYDFNSSQNSISFEFTSLDFTDPSKNSYMYKLEGIDESWINAGNKRYATFANISPGEYRFIVKGSNNDQYFDEKEVSFAFIIHPPFWATWWFQTLLILAALITFYLIYKIRLINQEKRLREIEGIRRRIADDFHDDLGHKLTRISLYSELIKNQDEFGTDQKLYLDKISEASNSLFYETKDFIWSIDPGQDSVYDVLVYIKDFGDDFFSRTNVSFKVDAIDERFKDYSLPMKMKREIVLIFKEAMHNVLKHSDAEVSELNASVEDRFLTIELKDNGKGFDVDNSDPSGRGLKSMKKRAAVINGKVEVESYDTGTTVKFTTNFSEVEK